MASTADDAVRQRTAGYMEQSLVSLQGMLDTASLLSGLEAGTKAPRLLPRSLAALLQGLADDLRDAFEPEPARIQVQSEDTVVACDPVLVAALSRGLVCSALKFSTKREIILAGHLTSGGWALSCDYEGPPVPEAQRGTCFVEMPVRAGGQPLREMALGLALIARLGDVLDMRLEFSAAPGNAGGKVQRIALVPKQPKQRRSV